MLKRRFYKYIITKISPNIVWLLKIIIKVSLKIYTAYVFKTSETAIAMYLSISIKTSLKVTLNVFRDCNFENNRPLCKKMHIKIARLYLVIVAHAEVVSDLVRHDVDGGEASAGVGFTFVPTIPLY